MPTTATPSLPLRAAALVFAGLFATAGASHAAEYRFTAEPIYPPETAREMYAPLMTYLNKATGDTWTLVTPPNYSAYWRSLLDENVTDFAFEEAHFADYRITRAKYVPLVRVAGNTSYTLVADPQLEGAGLDGLLSKTVVTMPAPSLGYALLAGFYPDPVRSPTIASSANSWRDAVQIVFGGEAGAAIIPTWLKDTYPNLVTIRTSREFAAAGVLAAPGVPEEARQKLRTALLELGSQPELAELLLELGVSRFVGAAAADYTGSSEVLSGFYGYKREGTP